MDIILTNNQFIFFAFVLLVFFIWFERKNIIGFRHLKRKALYISILIFELLVILGSRFIMPQISKVLIDNKSAASFLDIALFIIVVLLVTRAGRYFKINILF